MTKNNQLIKNNKIVEHRKHCVICRQIATPIIDLPNLPLTDSYATSPVTNPLMGLDQKLLYCESCGHGQLESLIAPNTLYGTNYCFRTSHSSTARKGTEFFISVLNEVSPNRNFKCVLDLGCNDLFLLDLLKDRAVHRIGIDPVWMGREIEREDKSIELFGMNFEDVDLSQFPEKPDLIVCRHTLEHIVNPVEVVKSLINIAAEDATFIFEVPGFDGLIQRYRFDQVFHQHAQYFSLTSFLKMLAVAGGRHLLHRYNFHDWGAMAVAFTKGTVAEILGVKHWSIQDITDRYEIFQMQMQMVGRLLKENSNETFYGYGAAQMLPVIGYHMNTDFSELVAVIDDDVSKDGVGYWNLPVKVISGNKVQNLEDSTVLITAIDNVTPIMAKLLAHRPRRIMLPLNII
jgi:SAM-dependent methyltransferase